MSIESRISKLELKLAPEHERPILFIQFGPCVGSELIGFRDPDLMRRADEGEDEFRQRGVAQRRSELREGAGAVVLLEIRNKTWYSKGKVYGIECDAKTGGWSFTAYVADEQTPIFKSRPVYDSVDAVEQAAQKWLDQNVEQQR